MVKMEEIKNGERLFEREKMAREREREIKSVKEREWVSKGNTQLSISLSKI